MFFIDDDDAGVGQWGEYRAAGADDDPRLAGADAVPLVEAFALGEV